MDQTNNTTIIITLLRRGETISRIATMLGVRREVVEKVMEKYIERIA